MSLIDAPLRPRPLVLIVDDTRLSRTIVVAAAEQQNWEVIAAESVETALWAIDQIVPPDVLFIDIEADEDAGVGRIAAHALAKKPDVKLLVASATPLNQPSPAIVAQLPKPYLLDERRRALSRALGL